MLDNGVRLLPRFDATSISERNLPVNKLEMQFYERSYDRSRKKCYPMINTNIGKRDLQHTYEILGNTLESYIHYRKLDRCQALANFVEYRNKIYKREKIGPYAVVESKPIPKIIDIVKDESSLPSVSPSTESQIGPSITITSSQSVTSEQSARVFPPTPIPSLQTVNKQTSENRSPVLSKSAVKSIVSKPPEKLSPPKNPSKKSTVTPISSSSKLLKPSSSKKLKSIPSKQTSSTILKGRS